MSEVRVVAIMVAKPDYREQVEAALRAVVAPSRKDSGCLHYDLHQELANPDRFVFIETWASQDALDQHNQTSHLKGLIAGVESKLEVLEVIVLRQIV
jgi:quinol monooxygenase YgiN